MCAKVVLSGIEFFSGHVGAEIPAWKKSEEQYLEYLLIAAGRLSDAYQLLGKSLDGITWLRR